MMENVIHQIVYVGAVLLSAVGLYIVLNLVGHCVFDVLDRIDEWWINRARGSK